jgi:hypothetical protein
LSADTDHERDSLLIEIDALSIRFPSLKSHTGAKRTLAWFEQKIAGQRPTIDIYWRDVCARMHDVNARRTIMRVGLNLIDNDFWICKRANTAPKPKNFLIPLLPDFEPWSLQQWSPPNDWRDWPLFNEINSWRDGLVSTPTKTHQPDVRAQAFDTSLTRPEAMEMIQELRNSGPNPVNVLLVNQSTGWLDTALGRLGRFVVAHSDQEVDPRLLLNDVETNVLGAYSSLSDDFMEDALQALYGSAVDSAGNLIVKPSAKGQSHEWRDYFAAFGRAAPRELTLMAVQLAAGALRSESVWTMLEMLASAGNNGNGRDYLDLSVCMRRRWMLALKALAWLEDALQTNTRFEFVTPADLACFAITSLLPLYPRPIVAVSHRGADAKPALASLPAWGANEVMLDATFMPVWQTNRAMVWSLFASTPVLCKIRSANYDGSPWCRLESELFGYLLREADFLRGRFFAEIDVDSAGVLNRFALTHPKTHRLVPAGADSPPMELRRMKSWEGAVIRAAATARFVGRVIALAEDNEHPANDYANILLKDLYSDQNVPEDGLWNFPQGWRQLSIGLRADAAILQLPGPIATVARSEPIAEINRWFEKIQREVSHLGSSDLSLCDFLAVLEWREHLELYLREHEKGSLLENQAAIIDLRDTNEGEWRTDPGWSVVRGLISLRLPYPIVVRQRAGQNADKWSLFRDLDIPMFTEHLPDQRMPQSEVFFSLGGSWPGLFANAVSNLVQLDPVLAKACNETLSFGPDPVMVRADGGLSTLSSQGHDFEQWLDDYTARVSQTDESTEKPPS